MKSTTVLLMAVLSQTIAVFAQKTCPENQYYSEGGPTCPYLQCRGEGVGASLCINTLVPVEGCFCNEGYYRSCSGDCVLESECSKTDDCGMLLPDAIETVV